MHHSARCTIAKKASCMTAMHSKTQQKNNIQTLLPCPLPPAPLILSSALIQKKNGAINRIFAKGINSLVSLKILLLLLLLPWALESKLPRSLPCPFARFRHQWEGVVCSQRPITAASLAYVARWRKTLIVRKHQIPAENCSDFPIFGMSAWVQLVIF